MKYILGSISACIAVCASAGSYSFSDIQEKADSVNKPVCRDFMENLRRLGNPPMVCDRRFHPAMKQFAWPRWQSINVLKHRDLIEQIWQNEYGWSYDQSLRVSFESRARSGEIQLAVTRIPIDGTPATVIRYMNGDRGQPCRPEEWNSTYPLRQFFIVDRELRAIDFTATYKSVLRGYYSYSKEMRPDLFMHEGKPYIAFWDAKDKGGGSIEVYGDDRNYCHINFTVSDEGKKK